MIIDVAPGQVDGKKGLGKELDNASKKLAFNVLQSGMYSYPIESTIRESASNSTDAIKEKNVAINILTGKNKVSDYYIDRVGDEYEASKFDKDYYDLAWLNAGEDKVTITYKENDGIGFCDTITIHDTGCGISPNRFVKVVGLLYSTKRNSLATIGGFGCGLKSPISTECDYFTIESCWNGKKVTANCYKYKTDFTIGKFNLDTGLQNKEYITDFIPEGETEPFKMYYEDVICENYTKVIIPSKKINRNKYKDAIKTQLMYFKDIDFKIIDEDGDNEDIDFKCQVLYNSKNIVVSNNNYYSRPHICIVKTEEDTEFINYGLLDFGELELEQKYGAIGIKCTPRVVIDNGDGTETVVQEGVTLSTSREKVIFNENTKNYLVSKFNEVVKEASGLIEKELVETDFIQWLSKASKALSRFDNTSVIGKMSGIIDKEDISPIYNKSKISFKQNPNLIFDKYGIQARLVRKVEHYREKAKIDRSPISDWSYWNPEHIYIQTEASSNTKDFYITTVLTNGSFILLKEDELDKFLETIEVKTTGGLEGELLISLKKDHENKMLNHRTEVLNALYASKFLKVYEDVIVPEDWKKQLEESEEKIDSQGNVVSLTPQEKRKLEQKIVVQTLKKTNDSDGTSGSNFNFTKQEPKIVDFQADTNVYYGTEEDKELLHIAANILDTRFNIHNMNDWRVSRNSSAYITSFYLTKFKLVKVAEVIAKKYCKTLNKIQSLFYNLNTTNLSMETTEHIRDWYTAKLINEQIDKLKFFYHFDTINKDLADIYQEVYKFTTSNFYKRDHANNTLYGEKYKEVSIMLNNMKELQLFVIDHQDNAELIAAKAQELFSIDSIKNASVLNMDMYNKFNLLISYAEEVYPLLNNVNPLLENNDKDKLTADCERLIKEFLALKKLDTFKIPQEYLQITAEVQEEVLEEIEE